MGMPLHYSAIFNQDLDRVREMIANGSAMKSPERERTPLHYAVINNDERSSLANELVSTSSLINAIDNEHRTALHYATMNDRDITLIKLLLANGASVHPKDIHGKTPLHYAAINNKQPGTTRVLLVCGADPNVKDSQGRTPLHYSIMNNRKITLIQELLKNGANVNLSDHTGYTPLYLAADSQRRSLEVVKELLDYGASINIGRDEFWPFYRYCNPLDKALHKRDLECAKLLSKISLVKSFNINCKKCIEMDRYIEYPDHNELLQYVYACFCELVKMVTHKIHDKITLYEYVTKKKKFVKPLYVKKKVIRKRIVTSYPIYNDIAMPAIQVCLDRANYLNCLEKKKITSRSCMINNNFIEKEITLNFDCIFKISEYLTNDDLKSCVIAFNGSIDFIDTDDEDSDSDEPDDKNKLG